MKISKKLRLKIENLWRWLFWSSSVTLIERLLVGSGFCPKFCLNSCQINVPLTMKRCGYDFLDPDVSYEETVSLEKSWEKISQYQWELKKSGLYASAQSPTQSSHSPWLLMSKISFGALYGGSRFSLSYCLIINPLELLSTLEDILKFQVFQLLISRENEVNRN